MKGTRKLYGFLRKVPLYLVVSTTMTCLLELVHLAAASGKVHHGLEGGAACGGRPFIYKIPY